MGWPARSRTPVGFTWWQAGVIYQIYPRSYADADGDGVGDLAGITSRLDHLHRLGVDALWLSPFYSSPMRDFGYDVTDHTRIDPLFGSEADVDALLAEAHRLGLRVLVDFIANHTSDQHLWFAAARSSREDPRRDWYLWAEPADGGGPPNNWRSVFGGSAWTLDPTTGQYYYHAYLPCQPDLNWRNPAVRRAQFDVMRTWLDRGVDGFRVDAFRHLLKDEQLRDNPPNPHWQPSMAPYDALLPERTADHPDIGEVVSMMRAVVDTHPPAAGAAPPGDRLLLAELYLPLERLMHYYGRRGTGLHLPSNMHLITTAWCAESIGALIDAYEAALPAAAWPNWVLGNHDRSRVVTRVGCTQARLAAMLLLTLRGTPTIYYGEEIGMSDVPIPAELVQDPYERRVPGIGAGRDPERTPMQWTSAVNAGFCPTDSIPWLPTSAAAGTVNVAGQDGRQESMLTLYRQLLALRRAEPALSVGRHTPMLASGDLLAYRREHQGRHVLVALNFGGQAQRLDLPDAGDTRVMASTDPGRATGDHGDQGQSLTLKPYEGVVLSLAR